MASAPPPHSLNPQNNCALFDRKLIRVRRNRIANSFANYAYLKDKVVHDLASRLKLMRRSFHHAVDLGCHTGQMLNPLQDILPQALISGDISEAMVELNPSLLKLVLDEEALPFASHSFDLVLSALTLHWINDLPGFLAQVYQTLKPDGLFLASCFGEETLAELRDCLITAEVEVCGGVTPRLSPMLSVKEAGSLLQRAGFALPVADQTRIIVTYLHPLALLHELRQMGETNALYGRPTSPLSRKCLARMIELYQERYSLPDGRITATFDIVTLTGWRTHASQPTPMVRGSAKVRLEDFI